MTTTIDRLLRLRAADVATREVVCVSLHQTMSEAAATFERHHITGAPVVDEHGHCVGVLSASDFARLAGRDRGELREEIEHPLVHDEDEAPFRVEDVPEELVSAQMSTAIQTIAADALLVDAARVMCGAHIHRLVLLGEGGRPAGILTSLDLVAAMVQAIDEEIGGGASPHEFSETTAMALAKRLAAEHERLHRLLERTDELVQSDEANIASVQGTVSELITALERHFAWEEEGGYMSEALQAAPWLFRRAAALRRQHAMLLRAAEQIREGTHHAANLELLKSSLERLVRRVRRHEQAEDTLLQEAVTQDIGAKD